jgi:hypothetical protein
MVRPKTTTKTVRGLAGFSIIPSPLFSQKKIGLAKPMQFFLFTILTNDNG